MRQLRSAVEQARNDYTALGTAQRQLKAEADAWNSRLVETRDLALLQEVGVYDYAPPWDDALAYKDVLADLKQRIKDFAKGNAVSCQVDWNQAKAAVCDRASRRFLVYVTKPTKRAIPAMAVRVDNLTDAQTIAQAAEAASAAPRLDVV